MAKPKLTTLALCVALLFGAAACGPSLTLQGVDYAQPIESVLTVDSNSEVHDQRYAVKFSVAPVLEEEGVSSVDEVRLIRNSAGFYFLTAAGFSNVYVFEPGESELSLERVISITENGLQQPAFNQRDGYVELVDMGTGDTYNLDQTGRR
ncbi:hypothetical protein DYD21_06345 [Rhodohalobacter sp. SW132]|uniref:hypothetical protein n=1 Tax=Rhodohalobacter sp. SW132 TaxID=2293433 RepID=UPI000E2595BE|nr:hypothetical protein [Rhodohalobacter sp. SW132]REL38224.1 hypothetical protein DYD21_06345 [Rhodohalobacter sp. SW132]